MKNLLKALVFCCLGLVFAACPPEPEPDVLSYSVNITSKVSGVVAPFKYEFKPGELSSIYDGYKIRLRTYIYGSNEMLVACDSVKLDNYNNSHMSNFQLKPGTYTAVSISDVIKSDGSFVDLEFWHVSNPDRITNLAIGNTRYLGGKLNILGIANQTITVSETNISSTLNLSPAGALICVNFNNLNYWKDAESYELSANCLSDTATLTTHGTFEPKIRKSTKDYIGRILSFKDFEERPNLYTYAFVLPMDNVYYCARVWTNSNEYRPLTNDWIISPKAGEEYKFIFDVSKSVSETNPEVGNVTNSTRSINNFSSNYADIYYSGYNEERSIKSQSVKLLDLLK